MFTSLELVDGLTRAMERMIEKQAELDKVKKRVDQVQNPLEPIPESPQSLSLSSPPSTSGETIPSEPTTPL